MFGPQATSGCKEWVYDNWKKLSEELINKGYKVFTITKNPYYIDNVTNLFDDPGIRCSYIFISMPNFL